MRRAFTSRLFVVVLALLLLRAPEAWGLEYEVEIDIDGEADLRRLLEEGQLSQASFDALLALVREPLDLNEADRRALAALPNLTVRQVETLEAARRRLGRLDGLEDLVGPGLLSARQARQLRPFIAASSAPSPSASLSGRARLATGWAPSDPLAPPGLLAARAAGPWNLRAGLAATTTRQRLDAVSVDGARHALAASPAVYALRLPKYYVLATGQGWSALLGTFRVGFGQRLTLDTSRRTSPDGFYPDDLVSFGAGLASYCRYSKGERAKAPCSVSEQNTYVTPDFTWSESFRGLAMQMDVLQKGEVALAVRGFGSYQSRSAYQYDLWDRSPDPKTNRRCSAPEQGSPECAAPPVFVRQGDPREPAAAFAYATLPGIYDELAAGGNVAVTVGKDLRFGLTGYSALQRWNARGLALGLRRGPGARFGALGVDAEARLGPLELSGELTRSFDALPEGGGFAAVQSTKAALGGGELALDLRHYGRDFLNPYAHAPASPDLYEGTRARNEQGVQVRWTHPFGDLLRLRGSVDLSRPLPTGRGPTGRTSGLDGLLRADLRLARGVGLAGWLDYRDKDLAHGGAGQCFETPFQKAPNGAVLPCAGARYQVTGRASADVFGPLLQVALQYAHAFVDDAPRAATRRQDATARLTLRSRPSDQTDLSLRSRYLHEDLFGPRAQGRSLGNSLELRWRRPPSLGLRVLYDLLLSLDARPSNRTRTPAPEHRLQLEAELSL